MLGSFDVADYNAWKEAFDADVLGRKEAALGHRIFQDVDDPNHVFVGIEFATEEDARGYRDRLRSSAEVMSRMTLIQAPTIVDTVDEAKY
jgi:hypothetical protein